MWIFLNDAFLSIVAKDCARDELLVRARRKGDIEKIFPRAKVTRLQGTDYLFRSAIKKAEVVEAMAGEIGRVTYPNFKNSVADNPLHDAYLRVWSVMAGLQPKVANSPIVEGSAEWLLNLDFEQQRMEEEDHFDPVPPKPKRRRRNRKNKAGLA